MQSKRVINRLERSLRDLNGMVELRERKASRRSADWWASDQGAEYINDTEALRDKALELWDLIELIKMDLVYEL